MENNIRIVRPGTRGELIGPDSEILIPPKDWIFLPAGDAGITRKVTSKGAYWRVEVKKGRRTISLGIWAPEITVSQAQREVQETRLTDEYRKNKPTRLNNARKNKLCMMRNFAGRWSNFSIFTTNTGSWRKNWTER